MPAMTEYKDQISKSCWTCNHQQIGGTTFLGLCKYPAANNPDRNKPIPSNIVDKGCPKWELKQKKDNEVLPEEES